MPPLRLLESQLEKMSCQGKSICVVLGQKNNANMSTSKESAERSGRYGSRAKEVAARTVMKQHKAKGHGRGR